MTEEIKDIDNGIEWLENSKNVEIEKITSKWKVVNLDSDWRDNIYFENDLEFLDWINEQKEQMEDI